MKKSRFILTLLILLFIPGIVLSANHYIRAGATGSNNGTNWTNAWNALNSVNWASVSCGDTIWVAGGTYSTTLTPQKNCTSGSQLYIRRARSDATECTGATGWSSGYDSDVHQTTHAINFGSYNYVTVSGRKTAAGSTTIDNTANGWWIDYRGLTGGNGIDLATGTGSYITLEYMKLQGAGHITYTSDSRAINDTGSGPKTYHTFSHMEIFDWESAIYCTQTSYPTFEYIDVYNCGAVNTVDFHPDNFYIAGSTDGILRYSRFHATDGQIVFFTPASGCPRWKVYGNMFYHNKSPYGSAGYTTPIMIQTGAITYLKIFNNVFDDNWVNLVLDSGGTCGTGCESRNNIVIGSGGSVACGTSSNNLTASVNPFVDRDNFNYHIIDTIGANYPRNAGINLSTYFTKDMDGNTFGADGVWDIGAYEFNSGSNPPPSPPKNLNISP